MYTFGLDIASYQGYPDMAGLKSEGHEFVISKVTGEGLYVNPYWQKNRDNALRSGLLFGTYDWIEPESGMTGVEAAIDYKRVVGDRAAGQLLCVDFETPEWHTGPLGREIEPFMRQYMLTLIEDQDVFLYTATYFLQETGAIDWDWLDHPRIHYWQAAPGKDAMMPDDSFWPWTSPPFTETLLHQHQWHATSQYVQIEFDRNRFQGTIEELAAYGYRGGDVIIPTKEDEVKEPPAGNVSYYVNAKNEPIFVWNAGGQTHRIDGVDIQDLGMTVESFTEPGKLLSISIQHNTAGDYHERPAPAEFVPDKAIDTGQ